MLESVLSAAQFIPHGYCLAWRPDLVMLHLISDGLIALSYFTIPAGIYYFLRQRPDFTYRWLAHGFAAFIICCGLTHVLGVMTLWYPYYGVEGIMKAVTAAVSVCTAMALWPLLPRILSLPSQDSLQQANFALSREIDERGKVEDELRELSQALEAKVAERTAELQSKVSELEAAQQDLTRLARDNQIARREAEEADRSKTAFLRNVCHELRTPLNAILGYSELLTSGLLGQIDDERRNEYLHLIHGSGAHLLSLLTDLIDLDQIGTGHRKFEHLDVDVAETGAEAVAMLRLRANEGGVALHDELTHGLLAVTDRLALKQVLINLLSNAVKYTPKGGAVRINGCRNGGLIEIAVCDNGIGTDKEHLGHLGQVFVRGGSEMVRQSEGSGRLALCHALLNQMSGSIRFVSALNEGTTVYITLPAARGWGTLTRTEGQAASRGD